jgi:tRNA(His) 5'-end guanylyltransferase
MELADRMKDYEDQWRSKLPRKRFIIVRVDGDNFHAFGRHFCKPFDAEFHNLVRDAALMLASDMQGFVAGYIQSDEASFLLTDDMSEEAQGWFDYQVNKIVSTSSARMSVHFVRLMLMRASIVAIEGADDLTIWERWDARCQHPTPSFDARAFDLPDNEVINYFFWRALDWHRNSVQMLARSHFSQKQLQGKTQPDMHDMLHAINVSWADIPAWARNGTFIRRVAPYVNPQTNTSNNRASVDITSDLYTRRDLAKFIQGAGNERVRARLQ